MAQQPRHAGVVEAGAQAYEGDGHLLGQHGEELRLLDDAGLQQQVAQTPPRTRLCLDGAGNVGLGHQSALHEEIAQAALRHDARHVHRAAVGVVAVIQHRHVGTDAGQPKHVAQRAVGVGDGEPAAQPRDLVVGVEQGFQRRARDQGDVAEIEDELHLAGLHAAVEAVAKAVDGLLVDQRARRRDVGGHAYARAHHRAGAHLNPTTTGSSARSSPPGTASPIGRGRAMP